MLPEVASYVAAADEPESARPAHRHRAGHRLAPRPARDEAPRAAAPVSTPAELPEAFRALGVSEATLAALAMMGYALPTPVQEGAIPPMLVGRDVVGQAQTGTGKTAAFGVPLAERLDPSLAAVQAIVLVPTRELAGQVTAELEKICAMGGLRVVAIVGGARLGPQEAALADGAQIVVGTPGRVQDHMQRGNLRLDRVKIAVLDEADEMLDIGFADDMERILRRTPRERQTALFSATMPPFIRRMIARYMREPVTVAIQPESPTVDLIDQVYYEVGERDKADGLAELLQRDSMSRVLVFCRMKIGVDRLAAALNRRGIPAMAIHGGLPQGERDRVMARFRAGTLRVLVATNVAARGLDIREVSHVVNFDMPQTTEEYIHRIGRTGRAGHTGTAVTFVSEWDFHDFALMCEELGSVPRREVLELYEGVAV